MSNLKTHLSVFILLMGLTVLMTYPIPFHMGSKVKI